MATPRDLGCRALAVAGTLLAAGMGAAVATAGAPHAAGARLPPPSFGRTLDIGLVSGTVIVTVPSGRSFTLGTQDRNIPIGSLIDTTHGRVDLRAAPLPPTPSAGAAASRGAAPLPPTPSAGAAASRVEDAQFYQGAFRVRQTPGNPVTQIRLAGGQFAQCSAAGGAAGAGASPEPGDAGDATRASGRLTADRDAAQAGQPARYAARATLPRRVVRLLRASGSGRFETQGRYAAATVRGTIWLTEDFCDGTLVQVTRGVVSVEDLVTHATVTVTAGHRFFAPAP